MKYADACLGHQTLFDDIISYHALLKYNFHGKQIDFFMKIEYDTIQPYKYLMEQIGKWKINY